MQNYLGQMKIMVEDQEKSYKRVVQYGQIPIQDHHHNRYVRRGDRPPPTPLTMTFPVSHMISAFPEKNYFETVPLRIIFKLLLDISLSAKLAIIASFNIIKKLSAGFWNPLWAKNL